MPKLGKKILRKGGTEIYSHNLSVKKKAMMVSVLHLALVIPNCQLPYLEAPRKWVSGDGLSRPSWPVGLSARNYHDHVLTEVGRSIHCEQCHPLGKGSWTLEVESGLCTCKHTPVLSLLLIVDALWQVALSSPWLTWDWEPNEPFLLEAVFLELL